MKNLTNLGKSPTYEKLTTDLRKTYDSNLPVVSQSCISFVDEL